MPISADRPAAPGATTGAPRAPAPSRASAGFTLIEIMCALGLFALIILPMLTVRQNASNMAYRSGHLLTALTYAERLLAERATDPERARQAQGVIEDDPDYRYELTLEDFDLSTGRVDEPEDEDGFSQQTDFSTVSAFASPSSDFGAPPTEDETAIDAYQVRRYKLTLWYPGQEADSEDKLVLEGYIPRVAETEPGTLLGPK